MEKYQEYIDILSKLYQNYVLEIQSEISQKEKQRDIEIQKLQDKFNLELAPIKRQFNIKQVQLNSDITSIRRDYDRSMSKRKEELVRLKQEISQQKSILEDLKSELAIKESRLEKFRSKRWKPW